MQKNKILLLILLGFGISMELVLGLYLLNRSTTRRPGVSRKNSQATLVSTIAVNIQSAQAGPSNTLNNSYPAPGDLSAGSLAFSPDAALTPSPEVTLTAQATVAGGVRAATGGYGSYVPGSYPAPYQGESAPPVDTGGIDYSHALSNLNAPWLVTPPADPSATATAFAAATASPTASFSLSGVKTSTATVAAYTTPAATRTTAPAGTTPAATATATTAPAAPTATPVASATAAPSATTVATATTVAAASTLVSVPAAAAPQVDGAGSDPAWTSAQPLVIDTSGGANHSSTRVTLRSVYTSDRVYFLLTWADATQSDLLAPWEKQPGGAWQQLTSADTYAEDQLALFWPASASTFLTVPQGQTADLWQWRSVRNTGQVDDLSADASGTSPDPSTGSGYYDNTTPNGKTPAYMPPGGGAKTGAPGYILDTDKVALDDTLFQPGDRLPSVITAPFTGDRGDITAAWRYANGAWTLEISRKLVTGSVHDVQFADLGRSYPFALATYDNTQAHPAVQSGSSTLLFQR